MNPGTHYALLVAINHYPGLNDLAGPENDAAAFSAWLTGTAGLPADNVRLIRSSDFARVTDPYLANPTETSIKAALSTWLKDAQGNWRDRVGERLYLFFAGHGFTSGSLPDTALFTAQAQRDDRAHIASVRYLNKIANAGFFDEIVMFMDCCQDVLKSFNVQEPTWLMPDNAASGRVKIFTAMGAPRGRKAFEERPADAPDGVVHGYFSRALLQALEEAPADEQGRVSARSVEGCLLGIWADRYRQKTDYEPPISAPRDMFLFQRKTTDGAPRASHTTATPSFQFPSDRSVELRVPDAGARITVFDSRNKVVGHSDRSFRVDLKPGEYRAQVRVGGAVAETPFRIEPPVVVLSSTALGQPPVSVRLPPVEFASPVPAPWSASHHEYQLWPCDQLLHQAAQGAAAMMGGQAGLVLFARDSAHDPRETDEWAMLPAARRAFRLRPLTPFGLGAAMEPLIQGEDRLGWCGFTAELPAGLWLLTVSRPLQDQWIQDELLVQLVPGWRTEVFVDCVDDPVAGRRYDMDSAALWIAPADNGGSLHSSALRQADVLRWSLVNRTVDAEAWDALVDDGGSLPADPVHPVSALYALARESMQLLPDLERMQALLDQLEKHWTRDNVDLQVFRRWCQLQASPASDPADGPELTIGAGRVPLLARSWELLAEIGAAQALDVGVQRSIAMWRTASSPWVLLQRTEVPEEALAPPKQPTDMPASLSELANALGRPLPNASLLHQALRSALLATRDEPDQQPAATERVARSMGVGSEVVREALADLWHHTLETAVRG